jgi:hypothetical protein
LKRGNQKSLRQLFSEFDQLGVVMVCLVEGVQSFYSQTTADRLAYNTKRLVAHEHHGSLTAESLVKALTDNQVLSLIGKNKVETATLISHYEEDQSIAKELDISFILFKYSQRGKIDQGIEFEDFFSSLPEKLNSLQGKLSL